MERAGEILAPRTKAGRTLGLEPHPLDTVMVVKRWLWDNDPSQQIAVAIPFQFMERFFQTQGRVPVGLRPPNPPLEAAGWLRCAVALLETHEEVAVQRPVRYLRSLARGERGQNTNFPSLNWMHSCVGNEALAHALGQPHMPKVVVPGLETRVAIRPRAN